MPDSSSMPPQMTYAEAESLCMQEYIDKLESILNAYDIKLPTRKRPVAVDQGREKVSKMRGILYPDGSDNA